MMMPDGERMLRMPAAPGARRVCVSGPRPFFKTKAEVS